MRFYFSVLVFFLAVTATAQPVVPLAIGTTQAETLDVGDADRYTLDLDASTFVSGAAQQVSVDVQVTVTAPDGAEVGAFDGPARGAEPFQFEAETAGTYTITVTPFEEETGEYTISLARVEPVATTPAGRVDQQMARFEGNRPGALVTVLDGDTVVFEKAYGMANLTHGIPMTLDTRTNIGSTSKPFTAMAIALLAQRGDMSLDDDVREYIPELPDLGETVTIRHLLTHTSGYRELYNLLALAGRSIGTGDYIDRAEVIQIIQRQPALQDTPGTVWNYNNTGYALAAMIVERVGGAPFPDWMAENIFEPLGMTNTVVRADPTVVVPNSAQGYLPGADGAWRNATDLYSAIGAGGIYTTVGDLARWVRNFDTMAFGGPDMIRGMQTPYVLADGDTARTGMGLFIDERYGLTFFHHGGSDIAHRSMVVLFPEIDASVIIELNTQEDADGIALQIVEEFFGDRFPEEPAHDSEPDPEAVAFDDALFDDYAGRYALDAAPDVVLEFRRGDDGAYLTQATGQAALDILPMSDSTFVLTAVDASVTFYRDADGVVRSATLHQNGDNRATKLDVDPMAEAMPVVLADYAGRYFSEELEVSYSLAVEDGALVVYIPNRVDPAPARPTTADTFVVSLDVFPITLSFDRDSAGAVSGFDTDVGDRTRGIRFERAR